MNVANKYLKSVWGVCLWLMGSVAVYAQTAPFEEISGLQKLEKSFHHELEFGDSLKFVIETEVLDTAQAIATMGRYFEISDCYKSDLEKLKSITLFRRGEKYRFPKECLSDLYFPKFEDNSIVLSNGDDGTLLFLMSFRTVFVAIDGPSDFQCVWTIQNGKVVDVISNHYKEIIE